MQKKSEKNSSRHLSLLQPILVAIVSSLLNSPVCFADSADISADTAATILQATTVNENKKSSVIDEIHWTKPISEGPDTIYYFAEAISGKTLKQETYDLLRGVIEVIIEKNKIIFHRVDNEQLQLSSDTEHGAKFFDDWDKSKINLEAKFGPAGKEFLDNIESVHVNKDRIQIARKGPAELCVELGKRKLHHAFDLRALRFRQISLAVDNNGKHPRMKDIEGVSAIINAPGFSFPVGVKEFGKLRLKKGNDINVGVSNPVPAPVRAFLFLPGILRFHFILPRKD